MDNTAQTQNTKTITLDTPITTGGKEVNTITVRKPLGGALRGLSLTDLLRLETNALHSLLPRVTEPMLLKQDVEKLDPADLVQLGTAVVSFLVPKADRADFPSA